jgi:UDP-2,4-diacetamido-2,4,6-trideoxy-beta-L-altropyranose hydrolase
MGRPGPLTTGGQRTPDIALRTVQDGDFALLLGWRNDPAAVEFSVSRRRVTAAEHEQWFARVCGDQSGTMIWIVEENRTPVGQVRVDVVDGVGVVSIAIAAEHRGRGIGRRALLAMVAAIAADGTIQQLRALAHPDNSRSLRAFEGAGFHRAMDAESGFAVLERSVGT